MKNISLTKVSVMVFTAITASFIVNANDSAIANESFIEVAAIDQSKQKIDKIAFNAIDTDKNGLLSLEEVMASNNQVLVTSFKKIDSNADSSVSQQELTSFLATSKS